MKPLTQTVVKSAPYTIEEIAKDSFVSPETLRALFPDLGIKPKNKLDMDERWRLEGFLDVDFVLNRGTTSKELMSSPPIFSRHDFNARFEAIPSLQPAIDALADILGMRAVDICRLVPLYGGVVQHSSFPASLFRPGTVFMHIDKMWQLTADSLDGAEIIRRIVTLENTRICHAPITESLQKEAVGVYCCHKQRYGMSHRALVLALMSFLDTATKIKLTDIKILSDEQMQLKHYYDALEKHLWDAFFTYRQYNFAHDYRLRAEKEINRFTRDLEEAHRQERYREELHRRSVARSRTSEIREERKPEARPTKEKIQEVTSHVSASSHRVDSHIPSGSHPKEPEKKPGIKEEKKPEAKPIKEKIHEVTSHVSASSHRADSHIPGDSHNEHEIDEIWATELGKGRRVIVSYLDCIEGVNPATRNNKREMVGERVTRLHAVGLLSTPIFHRINYLLKMRNTVEYGRGHRSASVRFNVNDVKEIHSTMDSLAAEMKQVDEHLAAKLKNVKLPKH